MSELVCKVAGMEEKQYLTKQETIEFVKQSIFRESTLIANAMSEQEKRLNQKIQNIEFELDRTNREIENLQGMIK